MVSRRSSGWQRSYSGPHTSDISEEARQALKVRVLDFIACAIGAFDGPPIHMLRAYLQEIGGNPLSSLIGSGGDKTSPEGAALYNSALVRYLDFNDSFLAKGEACHPAITWARCLPRVNMRERAARSSSQHWPWPTRCSADSRRKRP